MATTAPKQKRINSDMDMRRTTVEVPAELDQWVRDFATRTGRTYKGVVLMALQSYREGR